VEAFQALVSNDHIYSVINIVLVIQQVSVEVRGALSTKPGLPFYSPRLERMDYPNLPCMALFFLLGHARSFQSKYNNFICYKHLSLKRW